MIDPATISWGAFAWVIIAFALAMWLMSSALAGFERGPLRPPERILRGGLGVAVLVPNPTVAGIACAVGLGLMALHRMNGRTAVPEEGG